MLIYVIKTFRSYYLASSEEKAELKANKLYDELENDYDEHLVRKQDVWTRIDIYEFLGYDGAPFTYISSRWANKM